MHHRQTAADAILNFGKLPKGIVDRGDAISDNIVSYIAFRQNVCNSFRVNLHQDIVADGIELAGCDAQIRARDFSEVRESASAGNSSDCLELGLRMWTGCGAIQDGIGAVHWWRRIADPTHPEYLASVSRPIKAKALACLASAYVTRSIIHGQAALRIDDLYRACQFADECASYGLVTPAVLSIALKIEAMGLRRQTDGSFTGVSTMPFEKLEFLWETLDARKAELSAEEQKRSTKVSKAPNLYQCAAEGCGIQATRKSGLLKCSGNCLPDVKPSYCSKDCQRMDWKKHRPACKGNVEPKKAQSPRNSPNTANPRGLRNDGKELIIELPADRPGGRIKVASSTISPAWMKEIREELESQKQAQD